ncbi:MAG TPA: hypothetical protein VGE11_23040 [Pseudonocardia sp.]
MIEEMWDVQAGGRHALDEDAIQTPIFHALARGGRRPRRQEGATASLEEFRRDPLTAPIPIQALASSGRERSGSSPRERSAAAHRERSRTAQREWLDSVQRETSPRETWDASREWLGLTALAERGRHHLTPSR